jgi:Flp pilus assembly protein TadG
MITGRRSFRRLAGNSEGVAAVEFAIIINLFILLILGMVEFGHAFYMKQIIIIASREGARYGVVYRATATGNRIPPASLTPSIQTWILNDSSSSGEFGLRKLLSADANPAVTVSGSGANTGTVGAPLQVTVSCTKTWWVISNFLPIGPKIQLTAQTVMRVE